MSDKTHEEAQEQNFFVSSFKAFKTDIRKAPSFFDAGEVAQAILLFDGLGPALFENWELLLAEEGHKAVTSGMVKFYNSLPLALNRLERLSLKPLPLLSPEERDFLVSHREGSVNPLVHYFTDAENTRLQNTRELMTDPRLESYSDSGNSDNSSEDESNSEEDSSGSSLSVISYLIQKYIFCTQL